MKTTLEMERDGEFRELKGKLGELEAEKVKREGVIREKTAGS